MKNNNLGKRIDTRTTRIKRTNADFFFIFPMDALNIAQPLKSAFVRFIRGVRVPICINYNMYIHALRTPPAHRLYT